MEERCKYCHTTENLEAKKGFHMKTSDTLGCYPSEEITHYECGKCQEFIELNEEAETVMENIEDFSIREFKIIRNKILRQEELKSQKENNKKLKHIREKYLK